MTFKPITPADYPELKRFFKGQKYRLSAYSLPSILVWRNQVYQPYGAVDGDTLHLGYEFPENNELRHLMLPLSPGKEFPPEELYELALAFGHKRYCFIHQDYIDTYGRGLVEHHFEIEEQEEFADYVYRTDDLALLKGNKYSKKRNLIKQFLRDYVEKNRVEMESMSPETALECIDFLEKWCKERDCDADPLKDLACEKIAAINTLENFGVLEIDGLLLRVDGRISAFGVATHLTEDMGVFHFEKAFSGIKGLYQYFDNLCAKHLFNGYTYINKESDMGIPGLAQAKKSYHPAAIMTSYQFVIKKNV
jgi:uncharacterized protein